MPETNNSHLSRRDILGIRGITSPNDPPFAMVARNYATVNLRLPLTSLPNLARLNGRVERHRPKPKMPQIEYKSAVTGRLKRHLDYLRNRG